MSWWAIGFAVWGALGVLVGIIMALARTGPEDAHSNLSRWVGLIGISKIPGWLRARSADQTVYRLAKVTLVGIIAAGIGFGLGAWWYSVTAQPFIITSTPSLTEPDLTDWSLHSALHADFPGTFATTRETVIRTAGESISLEIVDFRDPHTGAEFFGVFVPRASHTLEAVRYVISNVHDLLDQFQKAYAGGVSIQSYGQYGSLSSDHVVFTNRMFIYHEGELSIHDLVEIETLERQERLTVIYRGITYLAAHPMRLPRKQ